MPVVAIDCDNIAGAIKLLDKGLFFKRDVTEHYLKRACAVFNGFKHFGSVIIHFFKLKKIHLA